MELGACNNNPTHFFLVRHWLLTKHAGVQAIVFFKPNDYIEAISKRFEIPSVQLMHSDIYIYPTVDPKAIRLVNNLEEGEFGRVMLWDGQNFVTENT